MHPQQQYLVIRTALRPTFLDAFAKQPFRRTSPALSRLPNTAAYPLIVRLPGLYWTSFELMENNLYCIPILSLYLFIFVSILFAVIDVVLRRYAACCIVVKISLGIIRINVYISCDFYTGFIMRYQRLVQ